jgi:hypothetical protein
MRPFGVLNPYSRPALVRNERIFAVKFTGSQSKYGSVEPPNGISVAELILH